MNNDTTTPVVAPERITVGPFTWTRCDHRREESWALDDAVELVGIIWSVTNYGPSAYPGSPFEGWRYGSGGPFGDGPCASREDAMRECIPYLYERMRDRLNRARDRVECYTAILARFPDAGSKPAPDL